MRRFILSRVTLPLSMLPLSMLAVSMLAVLTLALMLSSLPQTVAAEDNQAPPAPRLPVALIDLSRVFSNCDAYTQGKGKLEAEVKRLQVKFRLQKVSVDEMKAALAEVPEGSPDHFEVQKKIARLTAELQADMTRFKEEMLQREAEMYSKVYRQVQQAVARYAKQNGIQLVLRHQLDPIDTADRQKLLKHLNRSVVFQQDLDITHKIIALVNGNTT